MKNNYKEIQFTLGSSIESAMLELQTYKDAGKLVFGVFNGQKLYSDTDDLDSAYKKITGMSYEEFSQQQELSRKKYEDDRKKHKENIPNLIKLWNEKGTNILDSKYHELWLKIVPVRLDDLYEGMELKASLDIIESLNNGSDFESAKEILENQGHSGMSYSLVCSMIKSLCERGNEFIEYLNK